MRSFFLAAALLSACASAPPPAPSAPPASQPLPPPSVALPTPTPLPPAATPPACITLDPKTPEADGSPITLEGKLFIDSAYPGRPYILKLATPRCITNGGDLETIAEVHLAPPSSAALKTFVGQSLRVEGTPFRAHTGHHARDVVVTTKDVSALP